ncbi:MAG TPA: C69 family dipeptidase [Verrucomicrobiota bacterium]|nr:C69 family dipeptidase [Verrucomicrobiota bacterium]HNU52182.1 C69 family dipeptidase [Verrucomicrobiota bacterium]
MHAPIHIAPGRVFLKLLGAGLAAAGAALPAAACTSLLVTRGASADGSVMITYHCDSAGAFAALAVLPAADHPPGAMIEIGPRNPVTQAPRGRIPQVPHTYKVVGGLINEHQLALSETTFGGRPELINTNGLITYPHLMQLALQRARTAREAIQVMTRLVADHGYQSEGESISIADTEEAWILEIVGTGPGGKGAAWAAVRVPDGEISCHANHARLAEIPRNDPANCLFSENVESLAVSKGWYDPNSGQPFRFCDAYCPATPITRRVTDARVWSLLRRVAPSKNFSPDYHRSKPGAEPYPLGVRPDRKLAVADVFALLRDHYEGTEFDMTQGIDAGPFGMPRRWRPLTFMVDGVKYCWERPISTQQTAFSSVSQSRAGLPSFVGGLVWYGMDDSYTTCYVPFYCCLDSVPRSFAAGSMAKFSWDSAWWVFNLAANYAWGRSSAMVPEIRAAQNDIESHLLALQPAVEKTALELAGTDARLATRYLTDYSVMHAELTVERWRALTEHLITKYNDGYVRTDQGESAEPGYPEAWLRRVIRERPDHFRLPVEPPTPKAAP